MTQSSAPQPDAKTSELSERVFATNGRFTPSFSVIAGTIGAALLGAGVYQLWVIEPPLASASPLVALGGIGIGICLWFGRVNETAVAVGEAGVAVEDGAHTKRIPWSAINSVARKGQKVIVQSKATSLTFNSGANPWATLLLASEAKKRLNQTLQLTPLEQEKQGQVGAHGSCRSLVNTRVLP
ncbi:MAG: hypothetical protein MK135_00990 [Polyangiaceae bacterium]|nr:hypothetical protein [Polyangiaceae bacterium]